MNHRGRFSMALSLYRFWPVVPAALVLLGCWLPSHYFLFHVPSRFSPPATPPTQPILPSGLKGFVWRGNIFRFPNEILNSRPAMAMVPQGYSNGIRYGLSHFLVSVLATSLYIIPAAACCVIAVNLTKSFVARPILAISGAICVIIPFAAPYMASRVMAVDFGGGRAALGPFIDMVRRMYLAIVWNAWKTYLGSFDFGIGLWLIVSAGIWLLCF